MYTPFLSSVFYVIHTMLLKNEVYDSLFLATILISLVIQSFGFMLFLYAVKTCVNGIS